LKQKAAAVVLAASASAIAAAVAAGVACIPDLPADSADAQPETGGPSLPRCGDGIIQLDAGEQCDPGAVAADAALTTCTSDCKMICPEAGGFVWSGKNNHCYSLDSRQAGGLDTVAAGYCTFGAHVVTFASDEELQAVVSALGSPDAFWIGFDPFSGPANSYFALAQYEPGWSPACPGCYTHGDASGPLAQGCVEAFGDLDASWQQYPCVDAGKIHVICEREPAVGATGVRCGDGGVCIDLAWTYPRKHYVYFSRLATGDEAQAVCAGMGGTLVVLQSRDEREQLWRAMYRGPGGPPGDIWIGLTFADGGWVWGDDAGLDAYPSPFGDGQPKGIGSRAYLVASTTLPQPVDWTLGHNDVAATQPLPFVCQLPGSDAGP
jgi:hypothetical protein